MKLSILIPVYNEVHTLKDIIEKIIALPIEKELIIVDDFSTDGSRELLTTAYANSLSIKVILHQQNLGKGAAVKTALNEATGKLSIIQDADMEYDPVDYLKLVKKFEEQDCDAVYGSRFLLSAKSTSWWHYAVNQFFTGVSNLLFGSHLTDMETCYKIIKTDVFKSLKIECPRFEVEAEITAKLLKKRYNIIEVPISYKGRSYHEGKKITWRDGLITLGALFKYRFLK